MADPACAGCGAVLPPPPSTGGPARKWCSERCRKRSYGGRCVDCGAVTSGSNGRAKAPRRCAACACRYDHEQARWTRETVIEALRLFERRYGRAPAATDFHPAHARAQGHEWRADRFYADGCYPHVVIVQQVCGTWNAALDAAGLPRNRLGRPPGAAMAGRCHERGSRSGAGAG